MDENDRLKKNMATLESKISKASTYDDSELKPWYIQIDQIFLTILQIQDQYITLKSRLKNLTLRRKLKTDMEDFRKMLNVDSRQQEVSIKKYSTNIIQISFLSIGITFD